MNLKNITLSNISNYIQGNLSFLGDKLNLLPEHTKEQVIYRASQCPTQCQIKKECQYCGCDYPEKLYVKRSCNRDKSLPDLMNEEEWNLYKQKLIENKNAEDSKDSISSNTGQ